MVRVVVVVETVEGMVVARVVVAPMERSLGGGGPMEGSLGGVPWRGSEETHMLEVMLDATILGPIELTCGVPSKGPIEGVPLSGLVGSHGGVPSREPVGPMEGVSWSTPVGSHGADLWGPMERTCGVPSRGLHGADLWGPMEGSHRGVPWSGSHGGIPWSGPVRSHGGVPWRAEVTVATMVAAVMVAAVIGGGGEVAVSAVVRLEVEVERVVVVML